MAKYYTQAIRGMNDCLPADTLLWQHVESAIRKVLNSYCFSEIRLPIIEYTPLFKRAIGEITDVVEKEMYVFKDRNDESLSLRPEGTAGCARAVIEHGLIYNQEQRLWYIGPMFRYERPQKGRYRQFYQLGVEVFGLGGPDIDAELIIMTARLWKQLGIFQHIQLEINSIGSLESRCIYRNELVAFLQKNFDKLDADSKTRLHSNPLRILDSKNPNTQILLNDAPLLTEYTDEESREHFSNLCTILNIAGISYTINPRLVRGLDYYNSTVFEWVTTHLGAQGTICAGGRYDKLIEQLGGHNTPAVGFAIGLERLILMIRAVNPKFEPVRKLHIYVIILSKSMKSTAITLTEELRDAIPDLNIMMNFSGGSLKKQFSRANKHGAYIALILDQDGVSNKKIIIKDLRNGQQHTLSKSDVVSIIVDLLD